MLAAWQDALAAEQQAAWGYPLLGPHLPADRQDRARACQAVHEQVRNDTADAIAAAGATPRAPQGDYPALYGLAPLALAVRLEDDCAAAWRYLYAALAAAPGDNAAQRATAQRRLTDSAVRAARWQLLAGTPHPVVAFPGTAGDRSSRAFRGTRPERSARRECVAAPRLTTDMTTPKTWFITGASRGFGREWAIAALERGDSVAATARDTATLDDLAEKYGDRFLPLQLDVTDRDADFAAVQQAHERFGRLDVVVNNAGYGHFGLVEELTEDEARAQLETNLFGALWVTQAALPILRAQGSGHILQVSSIGGISAFPLVGIYHASKWALEGISQALAQEVADFGIKVTLIEPGGFSTDWAGSSAKRSAGTAGLRRVPQEGPGAARPAHRPSRATRGRAPRRCCASSTPRTRRCAASSARHRSASPRTTTPRVSRPGASGRTSPSSPRAESTPAAPAHARTGSSPAALVNWVVYSS